MRVLLATAVAALMLAGAAFGAFTGGAGNAGSSARVGAVFAPRVVEPPVITGTPRVGGTLSASEGAWAREPAALDVQWLQCDASAEACTPVAGASSPSLLLEDEHVRRRLRVRVIARNAGGSTSTLSAPTVAVDERRDPPAVLSPPAVGGPAAVGEVLTATTGTWRNDPSAFAHRWLRCAPDGSSCRELDGEDAARYRLDGTDADATFRVRVTATNEGGSTAATSPPTAVVARRTYTQILCANPATGQGVVADGVLPAGMSETVDRREMDDLAGRARCGGTMTTDRGIPIRPHTPLWGSGWAHVGAVLRYRAPANVAFHGATVYRRLNVAGALTLVAATNGAASDWMFAPPAWERCEMHAGCAAGINWSPGSPWANPLSVGASSQINGFNMLVRCGAPDDTWTCGARPEHGYTFYGAQVALRDASDPRVTTAPTGSLAIEPVLDGRETIAFAVLDAGSGVYRLRAELDGETVATPVVDPNGGRCADVNPANGDPYEFAAGDPCRLSLALNLTLDTAAWPLGDHRLRIRVEDAAGNATTVLHRDVRIRR